MRGPGAEGRPGPGDEGRGPRLEVRTPRVRDRIPPPDKRGPHRIVAGSFHLLTGFLVQKSPDEPELVLTL